jgi:hypothetical protein
MKLFIGIIFIVIVFGIYFWPFVSREKRCYDTAQTSVNDIGYYAAARGWDLKEVCTRRTNILESLEGCLQTATASSSFMKYSHTLVQMTLGFIQPYTKRLDIQKEEHASECVDVE